MTLTRTAADSWECQLADIATPEQRALVGLEINAATGRGEEPVLVTVTDADEGDGMGGATVEESPDDWEIILQDASWGEESLSEALASVYERSAR